MSTSEITPTESNGVTYLIGAVGGLAMGLVGAYLFIRTARENGKPPQQIKTGEVIKLVVGIITLLRQIAALAS